VRAAVRFRELEDRSLDRDDEPDAEDLEPDGRVVGWLGVDDEDDVACGDPDE
jgi:hypothetical protein